MASEIYRDCELRPIFKEIGEFRNSRFSAEGKMDRRSQTFPEWWQAFAQAKLLVDCHLGRWRSEP